MARVVKERRRRWKQTEREEPPQMMTIAGNGRPTIEALPRCSSQGPARRGNRSVIITAAACHGHEGQPGTGASDAR